VSCVCFGGRGRRNEKKKLTKILDLEKKTFPHSQAMRARLRELRKAGVPVTNYGLLLSAAAGIEAFERVVAPWGIEL